MNYRLLYCLSFILFISCQTTQNKEVQFQELVEEDYELAIPNTDVKAVLLLFGGYPEKATDIKSEFDILEKAMDNDVAVLYSNYNQKIWLEANEIEKLGQQIKTALQKHELSNSNLYIGGFSSGGNVAVLLANYLVGTPDLISPKGVFLVDSPVNLTALYQNAQLNVKRDFSEVSVEESKWLLQKFEANLGSPDDSLANYENYSLVTFKTENITNFEHLQNTKIRLYTEPDSVWWKENRQADFKQTNAYQIQKLSKLLKQKRFHKTEYIPTHQKGYRANGNRHPHSWSIVNQDDLLDWILKP